MDMAIAPFVADGMATASLRLARPCGAIVLVIANTNPHPLVRLSAGFAPSAGAATRRSWRLAHATKKGSSMTML